MVSKAYEPSLPSTVVVCRRCCMSMHDPCCSLPCHLTRHRMSRRRVLAHLTGLVGGGVSALTWLEGCGSRTLSTPPPATPPSTLYPNLAGQFGSVLSVGKTAEFPAALPSNCKLNQAGVFYHQLARTYVVHLGQATAFLLTGKVLQDRLAAETILQDADGSYWMALS